MSIFVIHFRRNFQYFQWRWVYIESTSAESPSYAYNVTKETGSQIYNAEEYYQHRMFFLHNTLKPALRRYLAGHAPSHAEKVPAAHSVITNAIGRMKSEFARTSLLERFIEIECQSINNDFLSYESTPTHTTKTSQMNVIEKLNQNNKKLSLTQDLMNNLKMRLESYNIKPLAILFQRHAHHLFDEAMGNEALGLNTSFLHEPLPNEVAGGTGGINAIGGPSIEIKNKLTRHISETLETLKGHEEALICEITLLKKTAILEFEQQFHRINALGEEALSEKELPLEGLDQQLCQLKDHKNLLIAQLKAIDANYTSKETALHAAGLEEHQVEILQTALGKVKESEANEMTLLLQKLNDSAIQISMNPAYEPDHIHHLSQVKIILEAHLKTKKLPFRAIDQFMQQSCHSKKQTNDFDTLITSLDQALNLQAYKDYRKRQESLFTTNPSPQEFSGMYEKLLKAINEKIRTLTDNIKKEHKLTEEVLKIKHEIQRLDQQQQLSHEHAIELSQKRCLIQLTIKEITEALAPLTEERIKISGAIEQLIAKESLLENSLRVMTTITEEKMADVKERTLATEADSTRLTLENRQHITPDEPVPSTHKAEKRKELIDSFILNLNTYKCDQQKRHGLFNLMMGNDKAARIAFIDTVIQALSQYVHLDEADNLLALIRSKITHFKGVHLQSRLNKITADVLDFEEGILQTESIESRQLKDQQAESFLNELNPHHAAYVASMRKLNENISEMRHYGEQLLTQRAPSGIIVTCLAEQLKRNTNHFIISHGAMPPSAAVYQRFFEKFTARLHSEDHIMSKDKGSWARIVANIAFILSWLIPKWLQPNSNHHRSSFFSNKTKDEQHRDDIETSAVALEQAIKEPRQHH